MGIKINTHFIQIALGLLWLLDGLLQLQPRMFTSAFAKGVLVPAAAGQPGLVKSIIHIGVQISLSHPAIINSVIALVQLGLGCLILTKRTLRVGLLLSILWSLLVWSAGEGFGGILSGHTLLLMGAPGAVTIYAVLALAVLPRTNKPATAKVARSSSAYWLVLVWAFLWIGGGIFQLLPGQNSASDVGQMISANSSSSPSWLAGAENGLGQTLTKLDVSGNQSSSNTAQMSSMITSSAQPTGPSGYLVVWLLATIQLGIGLLALAHGAWRKSAITGGIILSLAFWTFGQNFGGIFSGLSTDLNSGPLFVLLGLAILGTKDIDRHLSDLGHRIEKLLVGTPGFGAPEVIEPAVADLD